jgi:shikimate dehydrogenase
MNWVGLIGSGISYSVSPAMHNAAFAALGIDWNYTLINVRSPDLEATLQALRSDPWMGANVTIPHKQAVIPLLDELSPRAGLCGAVNTIIRCGSKLHGENTDIDGFRQHLDELGWLSEPGPALILGAGGAARAAALTLLEQRFTVTMLARTPGRAGAFHAALDPDLRPRLNLLPWNPEAARSAAAGARLVVNATPLGGLNQPDLNPWPASAEPHPAACFYDMTYNPPVTPFLKLGISHSLPTSSGLGMLINQGFSSFKLWTGLEPDKKLMYSTARQSLEEHHASISDSR